MHDDNEFFEGQYSEMEAAFRRHGGIVGCDGLVPLLHKRTDQPISMLARWIAATGSGMLAAAATQWGSTIQKAFG